MVKIRVRVGIRVRFRLRQAALEVRRGSRIPPMPWWFFASGIWKPLTPRPLLFVSFVSVCVCVLFFFSGG